MKISVQVRINVYPEGKGAIDQAGPRPWRRVVRLVARPEHLALMLILAWALALRLWFFVGLNWDDDVGYVIHVHELLQGWTGVPRYVTLLRVGTIYPLALFFSLFGLNNVGLTLFPLICSLASHILIYDLGRRLFSVKAGLLAALLLSFYPLDVIYATWMIPDVPLAFFSGLSFLLFWLSEREWKRGRLRWMAFALLAGVSAAYCYLLNERGGVVLIFYLAYFLYESAREWPRVPLVMTTDAYVRYGLVGLGFLGIFGLETFYYFVRTGDALYRYHAVATGILPVSHQDPGFYPRAMLNLSQQFTFDWSNRFRLDFGMFNYVIIPALIASIFTTERHAHVMVLWFLSIFLYLQFGSMSLTTYVPVHRLARHLTIITVPALLATGRWLVCPSSALGKGMAMLTVILLFFTSLYAISGRHRYLKASVADQLALHEFLRDQPPRLIYADGGTAGHLTFYAAFENVGRVRMLEGLPDCSLIRDAYVVVKSTNGWIENHPFMNALPGCVKAIPPSWHLLRRIRAATLQVYGTFDPEVYYAPP